MSDSEYWAKIVLICTIFLGVIALAQFLFVVSVVCIIAGGIWLLIDRESEYVWVPILMVVIGLFVAPLTYYVGYTFPNSEVGKPLVETAKVVVNADNTINEIPENITQQMLDATLNAASP